MKLRIGQGYDTHPFVVGRPFVLGGVEIPHTHGLQGHSDADALTHAICDALLGALGLGDIGHYFSDTDPANKNRNSLEFLAQIFQDVGKNGYRIENIDTTIITEEPKIAPHIDAMKNTLAKTLELEPSCINIKATRPERMGALGRSEGLLAMATVLLRSF